MSSWSEQASITALYLTHTTWPPPSLTQTAAARDGADEGHRPLFVERAAKGDVLLHRGVEQPRLLRRVRHRVSVLAGALWETGARQREYPEFIKLQREEDFPDHTLPIVCSLVLYLGFKKANGVAV